MAGYPLDSPCMNRPQFMCSVDGHLGFVGFAIANNAAMDSVRLGVLLRGHVVRIASFYKLMPSHSLQWLHHFTLCLHCVIFVSHYLLTLLNFRLRDFASLVDAKW